MILALLLLTNPPLPERVWLKTYERQFTAKYDLALFQGFIWWKPIAQRPEGVERRSGPREAGGAIESKEWAKFPPAGLPADKSFKTPDHINEISADGDNLVALDHAGRIYYAKLDTLKWTAAWGPVFKDGPLFIDEAAGERIAMSHRKMAFEDIDGNSHGIIVGVTTLYVLAKGGTRLEYTDPWLPPDKRHFVCLPEHGRFRAAAMSASASTVFVIDAAGRAYTKLGDFDSMGLDPVLRYAWERERRTGLLDDDVYSLPAHQWVRQPELPGPATTAITILQTGLGNDSRELRVGAPDGYWKKPIASGAWEKIETGTEPGGDPVGAAKDTWLPPHTKGYRGTLDGAPVTLEDFAPDCSPATLTIGGERMTLYFLQDWEPGHTVLTGALFGTGRIFHGRPMIEVELRLSDGTVRLIERFRPRALRFELELTAG